MQHSTKVFLESIKTFSISIFTRTEELRGQKVSRKCFENQLPNDISILWYELLSKKKCRYIHNVSIKLFLQVWWRWTFWFFKSEKWWIVLFFFLLIQFTTGMHAFSWCYTHWIIHVKTIWTMNVYLFKWYLYEKMYLNFLFSNDTLYWCSHQNNTKTNFIQFDWKLKLANFTSIIANNCQKIS